MQRPNETWNNTIELKAVIFDMDNTLFDFVEAQMNACQAVVDRLGVGTREELFQYFVNGEHGFEGYGNISDFMHDNDVFDEETFLNCCRAYDKIKLESIEPYPGVKETLSALKKKELKLAIVTDADRENAFARLEKSGLLEYFDVIITADISGKMKPEPDSIRLALDRLGVKPNQAILAGDSLGRDIAAGKKLGIFTAHAVYGDRNSSSDGASGADIVLDDINHFLDLIQASSVVGSTESP